MHEKIIILDFGGQYAHLIANRIRRQNVLAEIWSIETPLEQFQDKSVKGLILSGGPQSVFEKDSPKCDKGIFDLGIPILGICYGHQFVTHTLGGKVLPGKKGEFGRAEFTHNKQCPIFEGVPEQSIFWMNHVDEVGEPATGFEVVGTTENCANAALWNREKRIFTVQFHLEVTHSEYGNKVFENFLNICGIKRDWTMERFLEEEKKRVKTQVGEKNVFLFVSGGVDSSVAFALLVEILGAKRVKGLFVDTGLLRKNEVEFVEKSLRAIGADLTVLREGDRFLENLRDIYEPEQKREIIGHTFLDVQKDFFDKHDLHENWLLAQGTIYPDTIETGGTAHADKIKTHHNRAPQVQKLIDEGKILEPIKELYKDEVRALGELLGLPAELVWRHPFPGPGLGVRILCSAEKLQITNDELPMGKVDAFTLQKDEKPFITLPIKSVGVQGDFRTYKYPAILKSSIFNLQSSATDATAPSRLQELEKLSTNLINHYSDINRCLFLLDTNFEGNIREILLNKKCVQQKRVEILQRADDLVMRVLHEMKLYGDVWQFPVVLLPVSFNGTGEESIVLRPIDSVDAMSASVGKLPWEFFAKVAAGILQDEAISAVFLDVTSKPPGTIEWE
ncbi:glutamine-hydrolyzing GMP synthase [Candidatus Gracilibacteria bacterium]|nr:glutamine-hydrolyzing GMP synthase [Candidatus Gracilibacteria bacterium]